MDPREFTNANAIGKIGNVGAFNNLGLGNVSKGMRELEALSNVVRGSGKDTLVGKTVNSVLETLGFNGQQMAALQQFHPELANAALSNAQSIYKLLKGGRLSLSQIPSLISNMQNLEKQVAGIFGNGGSGLLGFTNRPIGQPPKHYALDLLRNQRNPKYKFLFAVQFIPNGTFTDLDNLIREMTFVVKRATLPTVSFETEQINMYNYRTSVVTRTTYDELSITFHDDQGSNVVSVVQRILEAMNPASRNTSPMGVEWFSKNGMSDSNKSSASTEILPGDEYTIFKEIVLYHVGSHGTEMTEYHLFHPKIIKIAMGEVDMAGEGGNEITITLSYDAVHIEPAKPFDLGNKTDSGTPLGGTPIMGPNPPAGIKIPGVTTNPIGSLIPGMPSIPSFRDLIPKGLQNIKTTPSTYPADATNTA